MQLAAAHRTLAAFGGQAVTLPRVTSDATAAQYAKAVDRLRLAYISRMRGVVRRELNAQLEAMMDDVGTPPSIGAAQGLMTAAAQRHADGEIVYRRVYQVVYPAFAERVYDSLVGKARYRPGRIKADDELVSQWEEEAIRYIMEDGARLIADVTLYSHEVVETTVRQLVRRAIEEGWSVNELMEAIQGDLISVNDVRARRIARTEVMRASSVGSRGGARSTNLDLDKQWRTAVAAVFGNESDERHTDAAQYPGLHGQKRAFNEFYSVGGHEAMYPLDENLPAEESINCRCAEIYIPK